MEWSVDTIRDLAMVYGLRVVMAIILLVVGKWLAGKCAGLVARILERQNVDVTLVKFLRNIIYYLLLMAVLVAAAGQLGINTTSFLTIIGAASLAIGLALKDSLSNFSAGVMLILFRPFRVNDFVEVAGGESGTVQEITIFNTILHTPDNQKKIIPNGAISNATITNVTANPTRRLDLTIGIGYEDDIRKAKETLERLVGEEKRIMADPAPFIGVSELGDSSVNLVCRSWVNTSDYWPTHFEMTEKIKLTFDQEGISIPYPQRDVHMYQAVEEKE